MKKKIESLSSFLALFTSFGTLICCALPILFVLLGAGATFAGLATNFPQLIWLAEHKNFFFIFAGSMIGISAFFRFKDRNSSCPTDPELAKTCGSLKKFSDVTFWLSVILFSIGFFFAYLVVFFL